MSQAKLQWCVWVAVLILLTPPSAVEGGDVRLMHAVLVSLRRVTLDSPSTQVESFDLTLGANPSLYCCSMCIRHDWCRLSCPHPITVPTRCTISDLIIMPTFNETGKSDAIICYTTRPKDLAAYSKITGGKHNETHYPDYTYDTLVDGIYSHSYKEKYQTQKAMSEKWLMLDFEKPKTFQHVFLYAQKDPNAYRGFTQVQVRVGNSTVVNPPAGFAAFDLFGVFPGQAKPRQVVEMKYYKPVTARFVSVQKTLNDQYSLQVSHIEVF